MRFELNTRCRRLLITLAAGGLGNVLAYLSALLISVQPQIAFDLSHLATFAVAIYFGPYYGLLAGAIVSIYPYIEFGVLGMFGPAVGLPIIMGKAMTGWVCGVLARWMHPYRAIPLSFIPECLFTFLFLKAVQTWMLPDVLTWGMISDILIKGWVEVLILSFVLETVSRRHIVETAVLLLEIFIITLLIHKQGINILALLLIIVFVIMNTVDFIQQNREAKKQDTAGDD